MLYLFVLKKKNLVFIVSFSLSDTELSFFGKQNLLLFSVTLVYTFIFVGALVIVPDDEKALA